MAATLGNASAVDLRLFVEINGHFLPCGYQGKFAHTPMMRLIKNRKSLKSNARRTGRITAATSRRWVVGRLCCGRCLVEGTSWFPKSEALSR
jgi:hypothetical protein